MDKGIPAHILAAIFERWKVVYGPTFPLYGESTVRHDISGSVRPLLPSTEIPHERVLAEISGINKKAILKIVNGETEFVSFDITDKLLQAMGMTDCWWNELSEWY